MRHRLLLALAAVLVTATGCGDDPEPVVIGPSEAATTLPAYDRSLQPAAAVMAVVPADATVLEVTDFDQVRLALGFGELTSESDKEVTDRFAKQSAKQSALLSRGMLRESGYASRYGFTQDDVAWEAHFDGPSGEGYVVGFRDDLDMAGVQQAAKASDGPLAGAVVVASEHLAALGATRDPGASWAADPALTALVGQPAGATYVSQDCVSPDEVFDGDVGAGLGALDPLGPFAVAFGAKLVTVQLGDARRDVFDRARLAATVPPTDPEFARGYADPVADPSGGRIGYSITDGPVAAQLAQERELPFAVCA